MPSADGLEFIFNALAGSVFLEEKTRLLLKFGNTNRAKDSSTSEEKEAKADGKPP